MLARFDYTCALLSKIASVLGLSPARPQGSHAHGAVVEDSDCQSTKSVVAFLGPERDRTADLLLAKQALSQLSYGPSHCLKSWAREDLNLRPHAYQACALTS